MEIEKPLKSFQAWLDELNRGVTHPVIIRDYDGLDRKNLEQALHKTPMTEQEFQRRLTRCSFNLQAMASARARGARPSGDIGRMG